MRGDAIPVIILMVGQLGSYTTWQDVASISPHLYICSICYRDEREELPSFGKDIKSNMKKKKIKIAQKKESMCIARGESKGECTKDALNEKKKI